MIGAATLLQRLQEAGLTVVGIERDGAVVASRDGTNLGDFYRAVEAYGRGPQPNSVTPKTPASTRRGCFEYARVEGRERWGRNDSIGVRLPSHSVYRLGPARCASGHRPDGRVGQRWKSDATCRLVTNPKPFALDGRIKVDPSRRLEALPVPDNQEHACALQLPRAGWCTGCR